jgi:hypothetical protein
MTALWRDAEVKVTDCVGYDLARCFSARQVECDCTSAAVVCCHGLLGFHGQSWKEGTVPLSDWTMLHALKYMLQRYQQSLHL